MIYFEADDGRICLVYDFMGKALVGSTDIKATNPDSVHCEPQEIAYFLQALRALLPGLRFDESQIIYAYAGIRPLPASDAASPGLISRDHSAPVLEPEAGRPFPVISLVGGKWTTFRGFAEEVADGVLGRLGRVRLVSTRDLAIGGGKAYPTDPAGWAAERAARHGISLARAAEVLARYGTTADQVLAHVGPAGLLADAPGYSLSELDWILRAEEVRHLTDLVMRRTTLAITGSLTSRNLDQLVALGTAALGWTEAEAAAEAAAIRALTQSHLMRLPS